MNNYMLLIGAVVFLPGSLPQPFNSQNDSPSPTGKSDGRFSYEFVPIKSREEISNATEVLSTIWVNKTMDISSTSASPLPTHHFSEVYDKPLIRNYTNHFTPSNGNVKNNNTGKQEQHVSPEPERNVTKDNLTLQNDTFQYYNVQYIPPPDGQNYWVDIDYDKTVHQILSNNSHRRATTIQLKFEFLFYGHKINNVTIARRGLVYLLGRTDHAWLAATQYVAPLMANFKYNNNNNNSSISYYSGNSSFTVQWNQLQLEDAPHIGSFTFQATLHRNGTILFVYKSVPIPITSINDTHHPVKIGLNDAYIRDGNVLVIKQKTIYEYRRVNVKDKGGYDIVNGSAIIFGLRETWLNQTTAIWEDGP